MSSDDPITTTTTTDSTSPVEEDLAKVTISSTSADGTTEATTDGSNTEDDNGDGSSSRRQQQVDNNTVSSSSSSALRANIENKGKNAYYYAHSSTPTGPKWDGKPNPKLLSVSKSSEDLDGLVQPKKVSHAFDIHKSNITSYAFLDEEKSVKLYITLEGIGEKCCDDDIELDWTESSFCLLIKNYSSSEEEGGEKEKCLSFGKLSGRIIKASYKLKTDKIILILRKQKEGATWHTINDKGHPDHEIV